MSHPVRHKTSKKHNELCVGIITIPHAVKTKYGSTHIMKAYVDWFEMRGVRVIPIPYDTTEPERYFYSVNGLLIPGGETTYILKNKVFVDTVTRFFELSLSRGEYFPIWGTCFGYELLLSIIGGFTRFKRYPAQGLYPLYITREGIKSRMFYSFTGNYMYHLEYNNSTAQNHDYGISPADFMANPHLQRFYSILATSRDNNGRDYVAAIEAKYYPIYGVQWHPERQKNCGPFADFFISELRKNGHKCNGVYPSLRTTMKAHKCVQYAEHRDKLCYFF